MTLEKELFKRLLILTEDLRQLPPTNNDPAVKIGRQLATIGDEIDQRYSLSTVTSLKNMLTLLLDKLFERTNEPDDSVQGGYDEIDDPEVSTDEPDNSVQDDHDEIDGPEVSTEANLVLIRQAKKLLELCNMTILENNQAAAVETDSIASADTSQTYILGEDSTAEPTE